MKLVVCPEFTGRPETLTSGLQRLDRREHMKNNHPPVPDFSRNISSVVVHFSKFSGSFADISPSCLCSGVTR